MIPMLVFFHGLFHLGDAVLPQAVDIIHEQMAGLKDCGLLEACAEFHVGINGGLESRVFCDSLLPRKARVVLHGLQCRNENKTIQMIENRLKEEPDEAYVCYFMAKGATFPAGDDFRTRWRQRMQHHVITEWKKCVRWMDRGYECCGIHYLTPESHPGLVEFPYFGGNFWWSRASYLKTLAPISESPAVKQHGLDAFESRYESESWLGHGKKRPQHFDFHPGWPA